MIFLFTNVHKSLGTETRLLVYLTDHTFGNESANKSRNKYLLCGQSQAVRTEVDSLNLFTLWLHVVNPLMTHRPWMPKQCRTIKSRPHQQQCRSNVRLCQSNIRLCCQKRQQCQTSFFCEISSHFDKVETNWTCSVCFDFGERIVRLVAFDNVALTLLLVWTGL